MAKHRCLRLDAAHTPAEHAKPAHHRGVAVGAHQRVREGLSVLGGEDHSGQVLEVHLVADPGVGRHHGEVVEGPGSPAQQPITLGVSLVLDRRVGGEGLCRPRHLGDHRVVDDELDGDLRVHERRVAAEVSYRVPESSQIDDGRDPGEVLEEDPLGAEGHRGRGGIPWPRREPGDIVSADDSVVLVAQEVLQEDLDRVGQPGDVGHVPESGKPPDLVVLVSHSQWRPGAEAVSGHRGLRRSVVPSSRIRSSTRYTCREGAPIGGSCATPSASNEARTERVAATMWSRAGVTSW